MKHLLIVTASLLLVSCGNMNHHRSGKLRKVRVNRSAETEQVVAVKKERKKRGYSIQFSEDVVELGASVVLETVISDDLEPLDQEDRSIRVKDEMSSLENDILQEESELEVENNSVEQKTKHIQKEQKRRSSNRTRIDWYDVGYYSIVVLVIGAIIVGLIFHPVITLTILVIALILIIVAIFTAIFSLFFDIFDMFFG